MLKVSAPRLHGRHVAEVRKGPSFTAARNGMKVCILIIPRVIDCPKRLLWSLLVQTATHFVPLRCSHSCMIPFFHFTGWFFFKTYTYRMKVLHVAVLTICTCHLFIHSVIHSVVCLATSPLPFPLHVSCRVQSSDSCFNFNYPLSSLISSNSCLHLLPHLLVISNFFSLSFLQ